MTDDPAIEHVQIEDHGRVVATAEVATAHTGTAQAAFHVAPGHLPSGTRSALVDAALDGADAQPGDRLTATAPLGDSEILDRVHDHYTEVATRSAGSTVLIDATGHTDPPHSTTKTHPNGGAAVSD